MNMPPDESEAKGNAWRALLRKLKEGNVSALVREIDYNPYLRTLKQPGSKERGFADFVAIFTRMEAKGFGRLVTDSDGDWHEVEHSLGQVRWRGTGTWQKPYFCQGTFDIVIDGQPILRCSRTAPTDTSTDLAVPWQVDWVAASDQVGKIAVERALGWLPGGFHPSHSED
jgi:hypothetical protein